MKDDLRDEIKLLNSFDEVQIQFDDWMIYYNNDISMVSDEAFIKRVLPVHIDRSISATVYKSDQTK